LSEREFLVAGVALCAGEGTKRDGAVRFANSDPRMIFFCCWLRRFFELDESRLRIRLYRHTKHVHGCATVSYSCSATHRSIMGLVNALLSSTAHPG
jgi:hypothetical protein